MINIFIHLWVWNSKNKKCIYFSQFRSRKGIYFNVNQKTNGYLKITQDHKYTVDDPNFKYSMIRAIVM